MKSTLILESSQFKKIEKDPTKMIEKKCNARYEKKKIDEREYQKLYPTSSRPGFLYVTAKVYKPEKGEGLNELNAKEYLIVTK